VLSNLLLSGVRNRRQSLGVFFFLNFLLKISIGPCLSVSVCSGVAFQPSHYIVSFQNLTDASMSSSVLRETFKVNLSFIRRLESSQFYYSDGQYVDSPVDWCFKLFVSIVLSSSRPLGIMSLDTQLVC
jgi:hypothetical protein